MLLGQKEWLLTATNNNYWIAVSNSNISFLCNHHFMYYYVLPLNN